MADDLGFPWGSFQSGVSGITVNPGSLRSGGLSPSTAAGISIVFDLAGLNLAVDRFIQVMHKGAAEAVEETAFELEGRIKERTPVDTGRARASWHTVTFTGKAGHSYSANAVGRSEARAIRSAGGKVGKSTFDGTLSERPKSPFEAIVGSNVEYMLRLEAGYSKQAPNGMVRLSIAELKGLLEAKIQQHLAGA